MNILLPLIKTFIVLIPVMIGVAFMTLLERKILSIIMNRKGPNKVSIQGVLQPMSDALKLAGKAPNYTSNFSSFLYYFSVFMMITMSVMLWSCFGHNSTVLNWKLSFLVMMMILGVSTVKAVLSGWSTFGKYSLIGSMRTVSQMASYEAVIYMVLLSLIWMVKSFNMAELTNQNYLGLMFVIPFLFFFWALSILAELNRTPYDFSEGESELVSGFNTEFGSSGFTLIFLSEYSNMIFFLVLTCFLFYNFKQVFMTMMAISTALFFIIWIRASLPRVRFDKFMSKAWKIYIPVTTLLMLTEIFYM